MDEIKKQLAIREKKLLKLQKRKEKELSTSPNASLRICSHGTRTQYYLRENPKDSNGVYIRNKDIDVAKRLAQKEYNKKVLNAVEKERKAIQRYLDTYPSANAEHVYETFRKEWQVLIHPIVEPDEVFVENWEAVKYKGKDFYEEMPKLYTAKGERVRSKSEIIIADILGREEIPYRYEQPLYLKGVGKVYPDFTILHVKERKEMLWEHLGIMDDPEYAEKAVRKIYSYIKNGIFPGEQLIVTYETKNLPINQNIIMCMIERYLK